MALRRRRRDDWPEFDEKLSSGATHPTISTRYFHRAIHCVHRISSTVEVEISESCLLFQMGTFSKGPTGQPGPPEVNGRSVGRSQSSLAGSRIFLASSSSPPAYLSICPSVRPSHSGSRRNKWFKSSTSTTDIDRFSFPRPSLPRQIYPDCLHALLPCLIRGEHGGVACHTSPPRLDCETQG